MSDEHVMKKLVSYIDEHLDENLSLDRIAEALNYSKFYISRAFAQETGCTIYKYIQGRRLTLAAEKLVNTSEPIIEIAYEAQYNSQQAFTLAFGRLYQCTPQVYRKNGVFSPKQEKITWCTRPYLSGSAYRMGGEMAA